jgi:hypothetical protein
LGYSLRSVEDQDGVSVTHLDFAGHGGGFVAGAALVLTFVPTTVDPVITV